MQKLVNNLAQDCLVYLNEEQMHTDAYVLDTPRVDDALVALELEFSDQLVSKSLLKEAVSKSKVRVAKQSMAYNNTVRKCHTCLTRFILIVRADLIDPGSCGQAFNTCSYCCWCSWRMTQVNSAVEICADGIAISVWSASARCPYFS